MEKIRIALADDEALFRQGVCLMLSQAGEFEVMYAAPSGRELVSWMQEQEVLPDIVLVDLKMPELDGIETTKILREKYADIKLIVLSSYYSETYIHSMLQLGASAYLSKNCDVASMLLTIREVHQNGFYYSEDLLQYINRMLLQPRKKMVNGPGQQRLTPRELEILILICRQKSTAEIARELYLSPRTVEGHRNNLLLKTGAKNMISLVVFALEKKIVSIEDLTGSFSRDN